MNRLAWIIKDLIWAFAAWFPYLCNCGHFCRTDEVKTEWATTGQGVTFCPACHEAKFPEQYEQKSPAMSKAK